MKYSSRFFLYAPVALFLTLFAAVAIYWWMAAAAFDKDLAALNGHEAVPGIRLSYASKNLSGFPFRLDVVFTDFRVEGMGAHGPFAWRAANFALHSLTYGRMQDIFEAAGQQSLFWTDGAGTGHHISFLPGALHASAIVDGRGLSRFDLDLVAAGGAGFTANRLQLHLRRDPDGRDLDLMAKGDQVALAGAHPRDAQIYLTLTHAAALAPLLKGTQSWPAAAAAWRAAGGMAMPGPGPGPNAAQGDQALLGALY